MTALNKQAEAGDVSQKTYYIHPAAFGGTKDPGHGHVPVVKVDDFEKLRAKLEAAEKRIAEHNFENRLLANADRDIKALRQRIAELEAREVELPKLKMLSDYLAEVTQREREDILVGVKLEFHRMLTAAGIGVKGE